MFPIVLMCSAELVTIPYIEITNLDDFTNAEIAVTIKVFSTTVNDYVNSQDVGLLVDRTSECIINH